jgi:Xaa-Pro aminopeptidase
MPASICRCITTPANIFSGFSGENSVLVVTSKKSALWADGRYFVQAEKQLAGSEIELQRMGEPGVPTTEEYCAAALGKGQHLGLCGLTASTAMVRGLEKAIAAKGADIRTLNLEDELWTEGRPALPATRAWLLGKEYAGFSPAEKLDQLRKKLSEEDCTAQLVGKLDTLAWLLNLRAMDINCTPYAWRTAM